MRAYFLRRLLLIVPTLIGITLLVFAITRFLPGGPVEQALLQGQMAQGDSSSSSAEGVGLSPAQVRQLESYYGFDQPWYLAYAEWLGMASGGHR